MIEKLNLSQRFTIASIAFDSTIITSRKLDSVDIDIGAASSNTGEAFMKCKRRQEYNEEHNHDKEHINEGGKDKDNPKKVKDDNSD